MTINWTFADGFDTYAQSSDLTLGYWDSSSGTIPLVAGRSAGSQAVLSYTGSSGITLTKSSGSNDAVHHVAVGFKFNAALTPGNVSNYSGIFLNDGATNQVAINFRADGSLSLTRNGTLVTSFPGVIAASNIWYGFEFEVVINGSTGSIRVRKNGNTSDDWVATGLNTQATANAYASKLVINAYTSVQQFYDDVVWQSGTATGAWLGDVQCKSRRPVSDQAVQWAPNGAGVLPYETCPGITAWSIQANLAIFSPFIAPCAGTLGSISLYVQAASTANVKVTLYSDNGSNAPGSIIASAANLALSGLSVGFHATTFASPPSLTQGTQYWVAVDFDAASGQSLLGRSRTTPLGAGPGNYALAYASFPPSSPTLPLGASSDVCCLANITVSGVANAPFVGDAIYDYTASQVASSTVGASDLYGLDNFAGSPTLIPLVVTRALASVDSGARSVAAQNKSGSTTSQGAAVALTTSWKHAWRNDLVDPSTSAAWTASGVNNLQAGVIVTA